MALLWSTAAAAGQLYWTDFQAEKIQRASLDGTNIQDVILTGRPWGIRIDVANRHLYWTEYSAGKVRRAALDGSGAVDLVTGNFDGAGIALDLANGKIYWTDAHSETSAIWRAYLDGSGAKKLLRTGSPRAIELDIPNGKMYWTDWLDGTVRRANLDGSAEEILVSDLRCPYGIALDAANKTMYWADSGCGKGGRISRANLDGTGRTDVISALPDPVALALDLAGGKIYWTEHDVPVGIRRANLDGTGVEDVVSYPRVFAIYGLAVVRSVVAGTVSVDGVGVAGLPVKLRNVSTGERTTTVTDADGQYQFGPVPAGTYTVMVKSLRLLARGNVSGDMRVNGVGVSGKRVRLKPLGLATTTDSNGAYAFGGVPQGTYKILIKRVAAPGLGASGP